MGVNGCICHHMAGSGWVWVGVYVIIWLDVCGCGWVLAGVGGCGWLCVGVLVIIWLGVGGCGCVNTS